MRKLLIAVLALTLSFSTSLLADESSKRKTVNELISMLNMEKMMDTMYLQVDKMFMDLSKDLEIRESESPIFKKYMSKVTNVMREEMSWQKMKEPFIEIYMKHYTEKELNDLLAFYKSDSGRKMIEKMPLIMQESMLVSRKMLKDFLPKIKAITKELKDEVRLARNSN